MFNCPFAIVKDVEASIVTGRFISVVSNKTDTTFP